MPRLLIGCLLAVASLPALGVNDVSFALVNVPALDEIGLAALVALVAAVGGWFVRRRK